MNPEPREVPLSVRLYLRLCNLPEMDVGWMIALGFFSICVFFPATMLHDNTKFGAWQAVGIFSFVGLLALCFPIYTWFVGSKAIRLLRNGIATEAKFYGVNLMVTTSMSDIIFTYQVDEKTYMASKRATGKSRLTINTRKGVFYDPMYPEQSVVLDGLPKGIHFDEQTEQFDVYPLRLAFPLVAATIVCAEVIAIVVLVVRAM